MAQLRSLASLPEGSRRVIARVSTHDPGTAVDLASLRIFPGETLEVVEVVPLGGPVLVRVGSSVYAVGRELAGCVEVEEP